MASANRTVTMNVGIDKIWKSITNYEKYPEYLSDAKEVKVLSRGAGKAEVQYSIELMGKQINYTLAHDESGAPNAMKWDLSQSEFFKLNHGTWELKSVGPEQTEVTYAIEVEFKIPVPNFLLSGIIKSTLPKTMEDFEKSAKSL